MTNLANQNIQVIFVLLPLFVVVILFALLLLKGMKKLEKYPLYWLVIVILLSFGLIYAIIENKTIIALAGYVAIGVCWKTFKTLDKKEAKKSKK